MGIIRGTLRLALGVLTVLIGGLIITLSAILPGDCRGIPWPIWFLRWTLRVLLLCVHTRVTCRDTAALRRHSGFIVANHLSYVDIAVLGALTPVRFLAKQEVREIPVVGWAAAAIGCVFVERSKDHSRKAARQGLARAERYPPLVVFPEGATSTGPTIKSFHPGSFEVAAYNGIPVLPCAISYAPWQVAVDVPGQGALQTLWRLVTFRGPLHVEVIPLSPRVPLPDREPPAIAEATRSEIEKVLEQVPALEAG